MKKHKILAASALSIASAILPAMGAFAVENYGIVYSGGEPLSASNVKIDPDLLDSLTPLVTYTGLTAKASSSNKWQDGYLKDGETCKKFRYFKISNSNIVTQNSGLSISFSNEEYTEDVKILNASLENYVDDGKSHAFGFFPENVNGYLYGMVNVFSEETCTTAVEDVKGPGDTKLFIKMNVKLRKNGSTDTVKSNNMYFGVRDIDAAQSFKILTAGNEYAANKMIARSAEDLQGPNADDPKNMFVTSGNYIYSEKAATNLGTPNVSNIYIQLNDAAQTDGVDIVFGYAGWAASPMEFLALQYEVTYESDAKGDITGIKEEDVLSGNNPTGSTEAPKEGYALVHWVADSDVTLDDGTTIKTGDPISSEQIKKVVVDHDITFIAIHEDESTVGVPNTGSFTGVINTAAAVSVSLIGVLSIALAIRFLPRLAHKKIKFD